ncbi:MAG TPA: DUF1566 domain-containing protein, partial [Candidatus Lambdaproteobacteria bacterium]|nr:DUF1566 domain-containing protein [Candidatus Lambdaproteobacteria bacterium]
AELEIERWKNENAPPNLPELKEHLQTKKTAFVLQEKRLKRLRLLIDSNKFAEARSEISQWKKTGEDLSGLSEMILNLEHIEKSDDIVLDLKRGLAWQKYPDSYIQNLKMAVDRCKSIQSIPRKSFNWRIPSKDELLLFFTSNIESKVQYNSGSYWSSTTDKVWSDYNWIVESKSSSLVRTLKDDYKFVICVTDASSEMIYHYLDTLKF